MLTCCHHTLPTHIHSYARIYIHTVTHKDTQSHTLSHTLSDTHTHMQHVVQESGGASLWEGSKVGRGQSGSGWGMQAYRTHSHYY